MKKYKIYCLKNPKTDVIRYIGITTQKYLSTRLSQHWWCSNNNHQTYVARWIRKLGIKPKIELIEICNKKNWEEREKYWIKYYDNLCNIHEGGKGVVIDRTLSSIKRSSEKHKIKIVQLDDNNNLIKVWNSLKEATLFFKGKSHSSISNVLNNRYGAKKAFNYQWFYYNDYIVNNYKLRKHDSKINYSNIKEIYLYDINLILIKKFKSLNLLHKYIKVAYSSCRKAINRKTPILNKWFIRDYKI